MRSAGPPTAVVTGVSSGIGRAVALRMAQERWRVIGTTRDVERARRQDWADGIEIAELDLSRPDSIAALVQVLESDGAPDVLVNNAGALEFKALEDHDYSEVERLFHVNVLGPMRLTSALIPAFRARGSGVIANISSLSGIMVFPFYGVYGGTKHALEALSETLWFELRPFGVRVKLIEPGFVDTPIFEKGAADLARIDTSSPYAAGEARMARLERRTGRRHPCWKAAEQIWRAVNDDSYRFRYAICGARRYAVLRRLLGSDLQMRLLWSIWRQS